MDTTQEYIEMCGKAEEIQSLPMKFDKGCVFFAYELIDCYGLDNKLEETSKTEYILFYGLSGFQYDSHYHFDKFPGLYWQINHGRTTTYFEQMRPIWLPRQDQLQKLLSKVKSVYQNSLPERVWTLQSAFNKFTHELYTHEECDNWTSMEQLWLAFVMKERYGKMWNGKDWTNEQKD
jgi:hypothetical protein